MKYFDLLKKYLQKLADSAYTVPLLFLITLALVYCFHGKKEEIEFVFVQIDLGVDVGKVEYTQY